MLEAADLPHCALSRALQARLDRQLAADRARRAAQAGLPLEAVPAVEGLTVRVINNVMKKCEVRLTSQQRGGGRFFQGWGGAWLGCFVGWKSLEYAL